ncbi:MAG: hypothetical protein ACI4CS_04060 [Candidatus Weimeria sp.]
MRKRSWIRRGFAGILALALFFPGAFGGVSVYAADEQSKDGNYEKQTVKKEDKRDF